MAETFNVVFGIVITVLSLICIFVYTIIQMSAVSTMVPASDGENTKWWKQLLDHGAEYCPAFLPMITSTKLKIIIRDKRLMRLSSYKIILCYGFVDITQLFVYIYNGLFAATGTTISKWAEKFSGFQLSLCWYNIGSLTVLLAANRLALLLYGTIADRIFSEERTWYVLVVFMSIPTVFSFVWLTPVATYGFNVTLVMWEYESPSFMPTFDRINTLTCSALSVVCYTLIVADVLRKSTSISAKNRRREVLITVQVMLNGGYTLAVSIYFMFLRPYYVPYTVFYNATDIVLCLIWNGKSPIMHLIFNKEIRVKFIEEMRYTPLLCEAVKQKYAPKQATTPVPFFKPAHRSGRSVY